VGTINVADHVAMLYGGDLVAFAPTDEFVRSEVPIVRSFLQRNLILPESTDEVARLPSAE
jgi:ABC-type transporter Mla maintaining outer membrane lipid asymmetry ATPase subunit MlaF